MEMCLIEPREAHDHVPRTLLREVFSCFELPPRIEVTCVFRGGMRARKSRMMATISVVSSLPGAEAKMRLVLTIFFNAFDAALVDVISPPYLVYLDNALESENGNPIRGMPLESAAHDAENAGHIMAPQPRGPVTGLLG